MPNARRLESLFVGQCALSTRVDELACSTAGSWHCRKHMGSNSGAHVLLYDSHQRLCCRYGKVSFILLLCDVSKLALHAM